MTSPSLRDVGATSNRRSLTRTGIPALRCTGSAVESGDSHLVRASHIPLNLHAICTLQPAQHTFHSAFQHSVSEPAAAVCSALLSTAAMQCINDISCNTACCLSQRQVVTVGCVGVHPSSISSSALLGAMAA
eukprot:1964782-Rhodomonas_salina.3